MGINAVWGPPQSGKTTMAIDLAFALSRGGQSVLLISPELYSELAARLNIRIEPEKSLVAAYKNKESLKQIVHTVDDLLYALAVPFDNDAFGEDVSEEVARVVIEQANNLFDVVTVVCAVGGYCAGKVIFSSFPIALAVGTFGLIAPLLFFSFRQTKAKTAQLERLASSMMILSNSYVVTEDFITSVRDNLEILEHPEPFKDFLTYVTLAKQEVTAHNPLWRGDVHFCNGGLHLVCFAMLKYTKSAVKRA